MATPGFAHDCRMMHVTQRGRDIHGKCWHTIKVQCFVRDGFTVWINTLRLLDTRQCQHPPALAADCFHYRSFRTKARTSRGDGSRTPLLATHCACVLARSDKMCCFSGCCRRNTCNYRLLFARLAGFCLYHTGERRQRAYARHALLGFRSACCLRRLTPSS